jgi:hypothetical protein
MVKRRKNNNRKNHSRKGFCQKRAKARKITASTAYETCTEQLSPFGGLLAMIKFLDLVNFHKIFDSAYQKPSRNPKRGHYLMMVGILMLLFIGFNRIWHFVYVRIDAMLCGFFSVTRLPAASTFWRYVDSLGINQAKSLLKVMSILRERVWQLCGFTFYRIRVDIDTTVKTVYGNQQGARKGHNRKHRGKQGLRPLLGFIEETREYLLGKLRRGITVDGTEAAAFIADITTCPAAFRRCYCEPTGSFCPGKVSKRRWKPDLTLSSPIEAAPRFLTVTSGIGPSNVSTLNITAASINPVAGAGRVVLWSCVF